MCVEPSIRQAAALTCHWQQRDIEAVVTLLAQIQDQAEAEDLVVALLGMRDKPMEEVRALLLEDERVG